MGPHGDDSVVWKTKLKLQVGLFEEGWISVRASPAHHSKNQPTPHTETCSGKTQSTPAVAVLVRGPGTSNSIFVLQFTSQGRYDSETILLMCNHLLILFHIKYAFSFIDLLHVIVFIM